MEEEIKEEKKEEHKHSRRNRKLSKGFVVGLFAGLVLASAIYLGYWYYMQTQSKNLTPEALKTLTVDFINEKLMGGGKIKDLTVLDKKEYYNVEIAIDDTNKVKTVVAADGSKFCVSAMDIEKKKEVVASTKTDKPTVELFVMSHCPYGTQIEKGIIPVIEALGSNVDFSLKFCNYSMHGEKELKEELSQYCIQKEQKDKLLSYLKCFLKAGDSASCVSSTGIDKAKLDSCVASSDKEFSVTSNFTNKVGFKGDYPGFTVFESDNTKYGVEGSPTLIINGEKNTSSGRNSAGLLSAICATYNNAPAACSTKLSSDDPTPGFGEGTTSGGSTNNAGCAQ